jgi:hypothetical protein
MAKEIHLVTYPRCGSTYLSKLFNKSFQKHVYRKHPYGIKKMDFEDSKEDNYYNNAGTESFKKNNYVITVLRNPIDAVSSLCYMENFYNEDINIDLKIKQYIEYYYCCFEYILKIVDLVIDFNDIDIHKYDILEYVSNETNNKIINKNYMPEISDFPEQNFLKSSKITKDYEHIKEKVVNNDLYKCYEIYNKMMHSCKKFK